MIFDKLNEKYLEEAIKLAQEQYDVERKHVEALYEKDYKAVMTGLLEDLFKNGQGLVAIENGRVLGYLSFWGINDLFGNVRGAFSPLFANAYGGGNRGKTVSLLFQYASDQMIKEEILSYAICVYSHDIEVMTELSMNGFGMRCSDAIRNIDKPLDIQMNTDFYYEKMHYSEAGCLLQLHNSLTKHLKKSPTYFPNKEVSEERFIDMCNKRQSRFFIARDKAEIIGYLEIKKSGETFITEDSDYMHICGAYLKENYRGKNILQSLLSLATGTLKDEGIKRLGVDCETINPTAIRFWRKYFDSYTYSFVRRIDERILE